MSTIRTIKLKRANSDSSPSSLNDPTPEAAPSGTESPAEAIPQAASPGPAVRTVTARGVSGKTYTPFVIAASLIVIVFIVIMLLQQMEIALYQAEPSVWLKK
jgi:hypothetical protein